PFIPGEEEKVERETRKILGPWQEQAPFTVSCTCTRVNVKDGHLESVFVGMERPVDAAAASAAMERFGVDGLRGLPSAPDRLLRVDPDPFRPQPRRDRNAGDGMTVTVGRIRDEPALHGVKYVVLSHNTKLGAGKGAVLLAEWLTREAVSAPRTSMALNELGGPAVSLLGFQAGIQTDRRHARARIVGLTPARIERELADGRVVVVAGFQGMGTEMDVTTLGRGGSDT